MTITEAVKILENAQKMLQPVLENWNDFSGNEEFKSNVEAAINLLNMCAEDLAEKVEIEDTTSEP